MFRFLYPEVLGLLLFLPLLIYWELRKKQEPSVLFSNVSVLKSVASKQFVWKRFFLLCLRITVLIMLILGLARPQSSLTNRDVETYGVDIVLVMDTSGTMRAEDLQPNRLQAAKVVVADFIKNRKTDRIGLVMFASKSFTLCPLTLDHDILISLLSNVQFDMVEDGTAIGMALANGVNRLRRSTAKSKVIILLTDGENNAGDIDPDKASKLAQSLGIKIYTIGVGKIGGAPIPINHPKLGRIYARQANGQLQLTKLNEQSLTSIATITSGKYFRATDNKTLSSIYQQIDKLEKTELKSKQHLYFELYQRFLLGALLLLFLEIVLKWSWWRRLP